MIYIQLHRFVNDCVKIDIIPLNTKKQGRSYRIFPHPSHGSNLINKITDKQARGRKGSIMVIVSCNGYFCLINAFINSNTSSPFNFV